MNTSPYFSVLTQHGFADTESQVPPDAIKALARLQFNGQLDHVVQKADTIEL
ncbi:MAG: hypothetical protein JNL55_31240 [Steroidobacter sp.]|nr:hypothetical protein [Steroidobacter sp.]